LKVKVHEFLRTLKYRRHRDNGR